MTTEQTKIRYEQLTQDVSQGYLNGTEFPEYFSHTTNEGKMHPYQLNLKISPPEGAKNLVPELIVVSGQLGDNEWDLLKRFNMYALKLFQTKFVQLGMPSTLNIKMEQGTLEFSSQLPEADDQAAFLHRLRPIFLETEKTNFDNICNIITTRLAHSVVTSMISEYKEIYHGARLRSMFAITITRQNTETLTPDEFIVNSDEMLKKWLYSSEYHFDNSKRLLIESFETIMPLEAQIPVYIQLLGHKMEAISSVARIIKGILGSDLE